MNISAIKNDVEKMFETSEMQIPFIVTAIYRVTQKKQPLEKFSVYNEAVWESKAQRNGLDVQLIYYYAEEIEQKDEKVDKIGLITQTTNVFDKKNKKVLEGEGITGLEIQSASTYGDKIQMSFSDYKHLMSEFININDFIFIWVFDLNKVIKQLGVKVFRNKQTLIKDLIEQEVPTAFSGIITKTQKDVASTNQFKIEAQDLTRILTQFNLPRLGNGKTPIYDLRVDSDEEALLREDKIYVNSRINQFFIEAVIDYLETYPSRLEIEKDFNNSYIKYYYYSETDVIHKNILFASKRKEGFKSNKIHLLFLKGMVMVIGVYPPLLASIVYKYFFKLLGYSTFIYPRIGKNDSYSYIWGYDEKQFNGKIFLEQLLPLGIIFKPTSRDYKLKFNNQRTSFERLIPLKEDEKFAIEMINHKILYTFNLDEAGTPFYDDGDIISYGYLPFQSNVTFYPNNSYEPIITHNVELLDIPYTEKVDEHGIKIIVPYGAEEIEYATRYFIYKFFRETVNVERIIINNAITWRATDFNPQNVFVASKIESLADSTSLMFVIKALLSTSYGYFDPIYTYIDKNNGINDEGVTKEDYKVVASNIRTNIWVKATFKLNACSNCLWLSADLTSQTITHYNRKRKDIKTEDILEYEINKISDYPSTVRIQLWHGSDEIVFYNKMLETNKEKHLFLFTPNSTLQIACEDVLERDYVSSLPLSFNTYDLTGIPFFAAKKGFQGKKSMYIMHEGELKLLYMSKDLEQMGKKDFKEDRFKVYLYSTFTNESKYVDVANELSYLSKDTTFFSTYSIDSGNPTGGRPIYLTGVKSFINPLLLLPKLKGFKEKITNLFGFKNERDYPNGIDYSFYKELEIQIKNAQFKAEVLDKKITNKIKEKEPYYTLTEIIDAMISWIEGEGKNKKTEKDYVLGIPVELVALVDKAGLLEQAGAEIDQTRPEITGVQIPEFVKYIYKHGRFVPQGDEGAPTFYNSDIIKRMEIVYIMTLITRALGQLYTELLAERAIGLKIFLPAEMYDIKVGDAIVIRGLDEKVFHDIVNKNAKDKMGNLYTKGATELEKFIDPQNYNELFSTGSQKIQMIPYSIRDKTFFVWKRVIYIGNAGSTSGFTEKLLLTDHPLNWQLKFEEENLTTRIAQSLRNIGFNRQGVYF